MDETPDDVVRAVLALDDLLRDALANRDFATIERLYAPNFTLNSPAGRVQTRQEIIDVLSTTTGRQMEVERSVEAAYAVGDVVVIMGVESLVWEGTGREIDGQRTTRRFTNVWCNTDGVWQHIARQATTVPLGS
jgi:ketosteroid isomerase-like protein